MTLFRTPGAGSPSPMSALAVSLALALALAFALAFVGGCSTQGEKMVESFASTRETVSKAQRQVDTTLVSLHALRSTPVPALKDGFRDYKDAVEKLEEQGADAKKRATVLQDRADSHIKAWEKEM